MSLTVYGASVRCVSDSVQCELKCVSDAVKCECEVCQRKCMVRV